MRHHLYTFPLLVIMAILTTVSCENDLPLNVKGHSPKLIMNALINADSLRNTLFLNLTGKEHPGNVENAFLEIRVNGEIKEKLYPLPQTGENRQCKFNISTRFTPGDVVRIDAYTEDGQYHAWAEAIVPSRPLEIVRIDTLTVSMTQHGFQQDYLRYKITIQDISDETNYYRLIMDKQTIGKITDETTGKPSIRIVHDYNFISREDVVLTDGHPVTDDDETNGMFDTAENIYGIFDDSRFKNQTYTLTVYNRPVPNIIDNPENILENFVTVRLLSISQTEYRYLTALNLIESDAFDEIINEPFKYPSNVHEGTGIVSISTEVSQKILIN